MYECVQKDYSKATAIAYMQEYLGLKKDEIYVVGDSANDLAMFQYGGHGIAMGDHDPVLDPYAEYVNGSGGTGRDQEGAAALWFDLRLVNFKTDRVMRRMWKEIPYFRIEGAFGGNQDWFTNIVMNMGGCGAATACDCCIYFALFLGLKELYPFDVDALSIQDYKDFSQIMKPYIRPRVGGVKNPQWFIGRI